MPNALLDSERLYKKSKLKVIGLCEERISIYYSRMSKFEYGIITCCITTRQ
jgi:hypothetical protein